MLNLFKQQLLQKKEYKKNSHRIDSILKYYIFNISTNNDICILKKYFGDFVLYQKQNKSSISYTDNNELIILDQIIYNDIKHCILSLGEFCNNYCSYCFYNKDDLFPTDIQVERFLQTIYSLSTIFGITIMGGEPTLYPKLQYIIKKIIDMNKYVFLLTSNINYQNIYNIFVKYHIVKYILYDKIILMNGIEMSFQEFKKFSISKKDSLGITQAVITSENYKYIFELEPYLEFRIQTDRKGLYMLTEEQISKIPRSILEREIQFYIQEVIKNSWITYNLSTNIFYNSANRLYV